MTRGCGQTRDFQNKNGMHNRGEVGGVVGRGRWDEECSDVWGWGGVRVYLDTASSFSKVTSFETCAK